MSRLTPVLQSPHYLRLTGFLGWWRDELQAAWAVFTRRTTARREGTWIFLHKDQVRIERIGRETADAYIDHNPLTALDNESWAQLAELVHATESRLVLAAPDIYMTQLVLPLAARTRLEAAVALQLGEISPLPPEAVRPVMAGATIIGSDLVVDIVLARRAQLLELEEMFAGRDIPLPPIWVHPQGVAPLELQRGFSPSGARRAALARVVTLCGAILAGSILLTPLLANLLALAAEHQADTLRETLRPKIAAERVARAAERLRQDLRPMAHNPTASRTLSSLAAAVPASAYVRVAEQRTDGTLALTIDAADPDEVTDGLAGEPSLRALNLVRSSDAGEGRSHIDYEGRPQ